MSTSTETNSSRLGWAVYASMLSFGSLGAAWCLASYYFSVPDFVMPKPHLVVAALKAGWIDGLLWQHIAFTVEATLKGLAVGCGIGLVVGITVAEIPALERIVFPIVIGIQSVPKVAVAPLIIVYFGFGIESKIFTVAVLSFFPIFIGTLRGMRATDADLLDLYKSFMSSRLHIVLHVRLPSAATYIFSAMQVAIVLGLIGCITSEFIASTQGLGFIIKSRAGELDIAVMFAAILTLSLFGTLGVAAVKMLERFVLFWDRQR